MQQRISSFKKRSTKLTDLQKAWYEMMQIINTISEILDLNTKPENIQRVIMEYYEQLYKQKFNTLDEMEQFLKKPQLPQL